MPLTATDMRTRVKDRTHHTDDTKVIHEIVSAQDWALNRLWLVDNGPDMLQTTGTELSISSQTREYDLGTAVSGTLYGIKALWLKLSGDVRFTPMVPLDMSDPLFQSFDNIVASDTTTVAIGHPVYYSILDFAKVRFAPPLPNGATVRADFWLKPPNPDVSTNDSLTYGNDIVESVFEAMIDKATAQVFAILDDDRVGYYESQAESRLKAALYVVSRRVSGPVRTKPFCARRRR